MLPPNMINAKTRVRRGRWWHESEVLLLIALVIGTYFVRGADLTIRGEESRWATVAREMIQTGNWIVPRQQGEPFLSRPPLGNWLIALTSLARGQCDVWAVRFPTLSAVLLTTILVYAFGRSFLNRTGALAAALAFCTMGEVLQVGRLAETDLIFTCLLSSAMIVWLWGECRGWPMDSLGAVDTRSPLWRHSRKAPSRWFTFRNSRSLSRRSPRLANAILEMASGRLSSIRRHSRSLANSVYSGSRLGRHTNDLDRRYAPPGLNIFVAAMC